MTSNDLQPYRKPIVSEAARHGDSRKTSNRDCITGRHPVYVGFHPGPIYLPDPINLDRKRRYLRHRQYQELIVFHEVLHSPIQLLLFCLGTFQIESGQFEALLDVPDNRIFNQIPMSLEILRSGLCVCPRAENVEDLIRIAEIRFAILSF